MSQNHTPGPWRIGSAVNGNWIEAGHAVQPISVARTFYELVGAETDIANAHLIAAAPDGLELAEDAVPILEVLLEDREEAIGEECEVLRDLLARTRAFIAKAKASSS